MNVLNIILLIIGALNLIIGITWSKRDWINFMIKLLLIFSAGFSAFYSLYLNGIIIVLNK